jgi:hypothetical protein
MFRSQKTELCNFPYYCHQGTAMNNPMTLLIPQWHPGCWKGGQIILRVAILSIHILSCFGMSKLIRFSFCHLVMWQSCLIISLCFFSLDCTICPLTSSLSFDVKLLYVKPLFAKNLHPTSLEWWVNLYQSNFNLEFQISCHEMLFISSFFTIASCTSNIKQTPYL